ncbi:hypothetical protein [Sulfitobacter sp. 1A12157]|uniref:hypothetical protein n=1 Tax=Sulfitobacter sp. 1A12157 TaxID=3368594 RepID=UPI003746CB80
MQFDTYSIAKQLGIPSEQVCLVGSSLICGKGNDIDVLCLLDGGKEPEDAGFMPDLDCLEYESDFTSYRKGDVNLLVTRDRPYFMAEVAIAHAARVFNEGKFDMTNRYDRVSFHGLVRSAVAGHMQTEIPF